MDKKKNTVQMSLVSYALKELDAHVTACQVHNHISKLYPSISKATVYRILNQMVNIGELNNIGRLQGSALYDRDCGNHYHFICITCKQVFNIDGNDLEIKDIVGGNHTFNIYSYHLSFTGLCQECESVN